MVNPLIFILAISIQAVLRQDETKKWETFTQESCCNTQSLVYSYNQKLVYIPNVFTPNGDGFNDRFIPYSEDQNLVIRDFTILSATGDSLLFFSSRIDYSDRKNLVGRAWNGRQKDGTRYQGLFKYRLTVGDQAAPNRLLVGQACALLCRSGGRVVQTKEGCFYAD